MLNISSDLTQSPCRSTAFLPNVVTESLKTNVRVCVFRFLPKITSKSVLQTCAFVVAGSNPPSHMSNSFLRSWSRYSNLGIKTYQVLR